LLDLSSLDPADQFSLRIYFARIFHAGGWAF